MKSTHNTVSKTSYKIMYCSSTIKYDQYERKKNESLPNVLNGPEGSIFRMGFNANTIKP